MPVVLRFLQRFEVATWTGDEVKMAWHKGMDGYEPKSGEKRIEEL